MAARKDGLPRDDKGKYRKYSSKEEKDIARKEQKRKAQKKYKENNKHKVDEQRREYRKINAAICIERTRKWQILNADRVKDYVYKRKYGLSLDQYTIMCIERGGLCDICKQNKPLVVDHCHNSNKVRGLLCDRCNVGIGCFEDDIKRILSSIEYLSRQDQQC